MTTGKGRGARDLRCGRRGGHWVDEGHTPGSGVADIAALRARAGDDWPTMPDPDHPGMVVARTAVASDPSAQDHAGQRRMAEARMAAGVELDDLDREALVPQWFDAWAETPTTVGVSTLPVITSEVRAGAVELTFDCPWCATPIVAEHYGPCASCRSAHPGWPGRDAR